MAKYYGVERSEEYLAHYGVRGMKWGIRRAKESGSDKRLWRQYQKAHKKLSKLSANADIGRQKDQQFKYAKRAGIGLGVAGAGVAGTIGANALTKKFTKNILNAHANFYDGVDKRAPLMIAALESNNKRKYDQLQKQRADAFENYVKTKERNFKNIDVSEAAKKISAGIGLGGYLYTGYAGARSLMAKYRQTQKGHAKAVAKRDAWQKEMKNAFKGTKYANSINPQDFGKEYYKRNKTKLDERQKRLDAYDKKTNNRRFRQRHD